MALLVPAGHGFDGQCRGRPRAYALPLSGAVVETDAVAVEPVHAVRWEVKTLNRYVSANPETRIIMMQRTWPGSWQGNYTV